MQIKRLSSLWNSLVLGRIRLALPVNFDRIQQAVERFLKLAINAYRMWVGAKTFRNPIGKSCPSCIHIFRHVAADAKHFLIQVLPLAAIITGVAGLRHIKSMQPK